MTIRFLTVTLFAVASVVAAAAGAEDESTTRLATCQDSWLDWNKSEPEAFKTFVTHFRSNFVQHSNDPFFVPKADISIAGLHVMQAFPENVGMGVGFSVTVDASFEKAQKVMERTLGKRFIKCEASDGMHSCELDIAQQRTFMIMADDSTNNRTLVGCYYYYEK